MKQTLASFIFIICFFACHEPGEGRVTIPENVLNQDQFAQLLIDFSLAESASNLNINSVVLEKTDSVYAFHPLKQNGVRKTQYDSTLSFYSAHPKLYRSVYDTVLARLGIMKLQRQMAKPPAQ